MAKTNISAVLKGKGDLHLENRPIPEPASNEVLIAVNYVGICGSDIHFWKDGRIGDAVIYKPMVLGHEGSGTVVKIGDDVKDLKPGDKVCLEPAIPCRMCNFCKKGRYNLCPYVKGCSTPDFDGCLCEYYCFPADVCHRLPDNVSLQEGALIEPLSVAVHACRRSGVTAGNSLLICGAGAIGLLNLLVCKAMGATSICITDICSERLELAKKLGATHQVNVKDKNLQDLMEEIRTKLGDSPDVTIECSGAASSVKMGIRVTKSGGVFIQVGVGSDEVPIPAIDAATREVDIKGVFRYVNCFPIALDLVATGMIDATKSGGVFIQVGFGSNEVPIPAVDAAMREVDIKGVNRYANCFPIALDLVATGAIDVKPLISHIFRLNDTLKAYEAAHNRSEKVFKVLIFCGNICK